MIGVSRLSRSYVRSFGRGPLSRHYQNKAFGIIHNSSRLTKAAAAVGSCAVIRNSIRRGVLPYSTERVLELRSGKKKNLPKTVYNAQYERENCGVGLVASLKSTPSRRVVDDADEMLVRMSHRGGCGCDPASGDGAGMCVRVVILCWYIHSINYISI